MDKYHFIGIKGSGMSALANIMHDLGENVAGSDVEEYFFTQKELERRNIPIHEFNKENIENEMIIIAGNAFNELNEEMVEARKKKLRVYRYHNFLGEVIKGFTSVAVSGAHGKTSTTGLASHVIRSIKPTSFLIGDGTGVGNKDSEYFVFEACEYKRHFLAYNPDYTIVTNIDFDHPDYFKNVEDVKDAFSSFMSQTKKSVIGCGDDEHVKALSSEHNIYLYGLGEENKLRAKDITTNEKGTIFTAMLDGKEIGEFFIPLFGKHHVLNALSVLAVCIQEELDLKEVKRHFATYQGVKRRFREERVGTNVLIDDYAHHPTEIEATISSVRAKYPEKECVVIFQPHTYSRTQQFLREFASSLSKADKVYLCDIFASAREQEGNVSIFDLINLTPKSNHLKLNSMQHLYGYNDKVLLFMGAGNIKDYIDAYKNGIMANI